MKYSCYTLDNASWKLKRADFLTDAATAFLDECDSDVFQQWEATFPKYRSLSPLVNSTIIDPLEGIEIIDPGKISRSRTVRAFNNSKYSGDTCLTIFERFKQEDAEIVVYIPTTEFRKKFRLDGTYMTIEQFPEYYEKFVRIMEPRTVPVIHFITLEDLAFETDVLVRGQKKFVKLIRN